LPFCRMDTNIARQKRRMRSKSDVDDRFAVSVAVKYFLDERFTDVDELDGDAVDAVRHTETLHVFRNSVRSRLSSLYLYFRCEHHFSEIDLEELVLIVDCRTPSSYIRKRSLRVETTVTWSGCLMVGCGASEGVVFNRTTLNSYCLRISLCIITPCWNWWSCWWIRFWWRRSLGLRIRPRWWR